MGDIQLYSNIFKAEAKLKKDSPVLSMLYYKLIGSDVLVTVEDCDHSIKELNTMKNALDALAPTNFADESRINRWYKLIDDGLYICNRDKELILLRRTEDDAKGI